MIRLALCTALVSCLLPAQQVLVPASSTHGAITATKDGLTLPAGEFTVADLIGATAAYLCRNYVYDADTVGRAAGFTLQRPLALDALGSEELLHGLLAARQLAALPIDELRGIHQIVSLAPDQNGSPAVCPPWRTPDEILRRPRMRDLVMTAIDLAEADAEHLAQALRAHFCVAGTWRPGILMAWASERRTLLLHGYRDQVAQVILLARQVDRSTTPARDELRQRVEHLERELAELRALLAARRR